MKLTLGPNALEDLQYWVKHDRRKAENILNLLEVISKSPFTGIGKPEPLKHLFSGCWSRRIDEEHRLIYRLDEDEIVILSCKYHYK